MIQLFDDLILFFQNQEKQSQACELLNCKTVISGVHFRKNFKKHFLEHFFTVANTPCAYCGLIEKLSFHIDTLK